MIETAGSLKYRFLPARDMTVPTKSLTENESISSDNSAVTLPDLARDPYANRRPKRQSFASYSVIEEIRLQHKIEYSICFTELHKYVFKDT